MDGTFDQPVMSAAPTALALFSFGERSPTSLSHAGCFCSRQSTVRVTSRRWAVSASVFLPRRVGIGQVRDRCGKRLGCFLGNVVVISMDEAAAAGRAVFGDVLTQKE